METELMHKRHKRRRKRGGAGLRKARCVVRCRAGKGAGKRMRRRTLTKCRRKCGVKKK